MDVAFGVAFADGLQGGGKIVACAVKQRDAVARVQPQYMNVADDVVGQVERGVWGERGGEIEAWHNVRIC